MDSPSAETILLTGGSGQVGAAFARLAAGRGLKVFAPGRDGRDLADPASRGAVGGGPWAAFVNCGAYTAVDAAEGEEGLAAAVNAAAPALLARGAARTGSALFHVSTDYVFDGAKAAPYV